MYVKTLIVDNLEDIESASITKETLYPTWHDIEIAVREMDGDGRSIVILSPALSKEGAESEYLNIGGGKDATYICFAWDAQGREFALINPSQTSTEFVKILAGETLTRSIKECVDLKSILIAAKTYAEYGRLDERLVWKEC